MTLTCESYLWGGSQTMTRNFQMHCACDDSPSPLSYLSNHFWLWKQKWLNSISSHKHPAVANSFGIKIISCEIDAYLCNSEGPTIFRFQTKTQSFKHILLLPTSILRVSQVPEKHPWYPHMSQLVFEKSYLS